MNEHLCTGSDKSRYPSINAPDKIRRLYLLATFDVYIALADLIIFSLLAFDVSPFAFDVSLLAFGRLNYG
jgi:hypothetical protein